MTELCLTQMFNTSGESGTLGGGDHQLLQKKSEASCHQPTSTTIDMPVTIHEKAENDSVMF